ncbi:MAG TPA: aminopeptidase N [Nannocystaceae bacterium]|nr:aminopeptidase N [Nannocystaceae bacterium]
MKDPRPQPIRREDYRPPGFLIDAVDLEVELGEEVTRVVASLKVRRNPAVPRVADLRLHGERLRLIGVELDDVALPDARYRVEPDALVVVDVPDAFVLRTVVEIEPQNNTELTGLYRTGSGFCTQCEAEGFRRITYFLDRPDVMALYTTTIIADASRYPVLLSNGNRIESTVLPDGRTRVRWQDPFPKPSYLFALVAADLRCKAGTFTTRSGRVVRLEVWVEPPHVDACDHAVRSLQRAMKWDEDTFGLEYDLDIYMIVAVGDFNMGAMENKGLNVFNAKYVLARPETATDDDYEDIEGVIAHEYFHNWTGNRVTCRDWFQLTLKEGLTVFRDEQFTADMTSRAVKRIADVVTLRTAQFAEDQSPTAHPIRPESYIEMNNFYTVTVYNKGAEVVRMMHTLLGEAGFRRGMDLYFQRHDGQAVTCDDFRIALADANGADLAQFENWYLQAGTPIVEVDASHDAKAERYTLVLRQRAPVNADEGAWRPMHVPIAVGLLGPDGRDLPIAIASGPATVRGTTALVELRDAQTRVVFEHVAAPPVPSLLRNFSAPVKLRFERSTEELAFIMAHDADAFSRWDAAQTLGEATIAALVRERAAGRPLAIDERFIAAFGRLVVDPGLDGSLRALMMTLPDERVLAQHATVVDVDGIHDARQLVLGKLAAAHTNALRELYERERPRGAYDNSQRSIASRRARNAALRYLVAGGGADACELALAQFRTGDNMTDVQAALQSLVDCEGDVADAPLQEFYARWRHDALVLDKWFAAQAVSIRKDTLARVTALRNHPDFNLKNPNRVRALLGSFSVRNQVRFHERSGAGYRLLADAVLELDAINPQVAARLVGPFVQWRRLDDARSEAMRTELARIVARPQLSRDVFELASKALAD